VHSAAWDGLVYFNPYTGARGKTEGWVNTLFELHSELLASEDGKRIVAFDGLIMLAMLLTGYVLWWPLRWKGAFKIKLDTGTLRALLDLHRFGGAVLGLWVLACVASGTWLWWLRRRMRRNRPGLSAAGTNNHKRAPPSFHGRAHAKEIGTARKPAPPGPRGCCRDG